MNAVADAAAASAERLKLTEIFLSLQGEARDAGWPTVFVRLTGCPLRCQYCDTAYAFHGGEWWTLDAILAEVARHGVRSGQAWMNTGLRLTLADLESTIRRIQRVG